VLPAMERPSLPLTNLNLGSSTMQMPWTTQRRGCISLETEISFAITLNFRTCIVSSFLAHLSSSTGRAVTRPLEHSCYCGWIIKEIISFGSSRVSRTLVSCIFARDFSDPFLPSKLKHLLGLYFYLATYVMASSGAFSMSQGARRLRQ
jgi:hypothetical protein